jgi:hypothetical protein
MAISTKWLALLALLSLLLLPALSSGAKVKFELPWRGRKESRLMKWFASAGGRAENVVVAKTDGGSRGLVATGDIEAGQVLLKVPPQLVICGKGLGDGTVLGVDDGARRVYATLVNGDTAIALFLLRERALGGKSVWAPYINALPSTVPQISLWSDQELDLLEDEKVAKRARETRAEVEALYSSLSGALQALIGPRALEKAADLAAFQWAISLIDSRALNLQGFKYLVPIADMVNHFPHPIARSMQDGSFFLDHHKLTEEGGIVVQADRPVNEGQEVVEDYGDNPNLTYLQYHGFVPSTVNPMECVRLDMSTLSPPYFLSLLIQSLRLESGTTPCVKSDMELPRNSERILGIMHMKEIDQHRCEAVVGTPRIEADCFSAEVTPRQRALAIQKMAHAKLHHYSTTAEEDALMLGVKGRSEVEVLAISYRRNQKLLLEQLIAAADEAARAALPQPTPSALELKAEIQPSIDAFMQWLMEMDVPVNRLQPEVTPSGGLMRLGTVAVGDIQEEEIYISLPQSAIMDVRAAYADADLGPVIVSMAADEQQRYWHDDTDPLLMLLVYEAFVRREEGKWWPYIQLLPGPQEIRNSLLWPEEALELLQGSSLHWAVEGYRGTIMANFEAKWAENQILTEAFGDNFMTKERFFWASAILDTRSIWWDNGKHLVPLLDLVNCASGKEGVRVHETKLSEDGYVITRAAQPFTPGEEVTEDYGQPNHTLLQYHGFVLEDNLHDCLRFNGHHNEKMSYDIRVKLSRLFSQSPVFCINPSAISMHFVAFARVVAGADFPPPGGISWENALDRVGVNACIDLLKALKSDRLAAGRTKSARPEVPLDLADTLNRFMDAEDAMLESVLAHFEGKLSTLPEAPMEPQDSLRTEEVAAGREQVGLENAEHGASRAAAGTPTLTEEL